MLVEELLELLVDIVDANLLKAVVVEDLKAGNIEDTDVGDLLHGGVAQGLVTLLHLLFNTISTCIKKYEKCMMKKKMTH